MKKIALLLTLISFTAQAQWNDPKVGSQGKEPSRSQFMSYDRRDDAVFDYTKSPFYTSLNGEWNFRIAPTPEEIDAAFYTNSSSSQKIKVPSFWAKAAAEELARVYPPQLPKDNPVGQYEKDITIPVSWLDRDIFINIAGAKSGFSLYVNGKKIGYSEDPSIPAEFNITKYVTDGKNRIGIEVYKWTTGSWLENNTIEGAGIADGVYIYSQPKIHIADFVVDAKLDSLYKNGVMNLDIIVANNYNVTEKVTVYYDLMNSKGDIVRYNYREVEISPSGLDTVRYTAVVPNVASWSAQNPEQYQLMMRIRYNGRFTEYIPFKIGFRSIEKKNGSYFINGKPLNMKVKNWEFSGVSPDDNALRAQLSQIKKEGYNTISCVYHPNKNRLYELCSEMGIYVIDLLNIDTSLSGKDLSSGGNIGNIPQWVNSFTSRAENSYGAIRNHTSVVKWSLGENAGVGYNIYKLSGRMRELNKKFIVVE